jgi:DNA-binding XRE family transcriptional regulator
MSPAEFTNIRNTLKKSQSSFAALLGISIRSVQAYEQGWREIPSQVARMAFYILYQKHLGQRAVKPCWEIKKCPHQWWEKCPVKEFEAQGPCWFLNGNFCQGDHHAAWDEKMEICKACLVYKNVMK